MFPQSSLSGRRFKVRIFFREYFQARGGNSQGVHDREVLRSPARKDHVHGQKPSGTRVATRERLGKPSATPRRGRSSALQDSAESYRIGRIRTAVRSPFWRYHVCWSTRAIRICNCWKKKAAFRDIKRHQTGRQTAREQQPSVSWQAFLERQRR